MLIETANTEFVDLVQTMYLKKHDERFPRLIAELERLEEVFKEITKILSTDTVVFIDEAKFERDCIVKIQNLY